MQHRLWSALRTAGTWLRRGLQGALEAIIAIVILFEEWGWRPLANLVARLARWRPWAVVEARIAKLPPYGALAVFVLPSATLFPLKLLALWLIANGQTFAAGGLFVAAKVVGTGLVARIFQLTRPILMQLGWFAWLYNLVVPWKEALLERVRQSWVWRQSRVIKERLRWAGRALLARYEPTIVALRGRLRTLVAVWRVRLAGLFRGRRPPAGR